MTSRIRANGIGQPNDPKRPRNDREEFFRALDELRRILLREGLAFLGWLGRHPRFVVAYLALTVALILEDVL